MNGPGIRWTVGDVSDRGYEALRLSAWGAWKLFGSEAEYVVCVNTISADEAIERAGVMPPGLQWIEVSTADLPAFVHDRLGTGLAGGAAWKLAPVRLFPDRYEVSLDNDVVLWRLPERLAGWLEGLRSSVLAEDVRRSMGSFDDRCGPGAWNAGIRGLPPGLDLEAAVRRTLESSGVLLNSELDEQGLQIAALSSCTTIETVTLDEVSICSPIPPHYQLLGSCGAHFVGLNARSMSWTYGGESPVDLIARHWDSCRPVLYRQVGLEESALSLF